MTQKFSAADFANARFAQHEDGDFAVRLYPQEVDPWLGGGECAYTDQMLADTGWVPVPTKPTITGREFMAAYNMFSNADGSDCYREFLAHLGFEIVPDPEPTDEELLAGIIRNIDDWQSITSPELLAKYLNTAGVTVHKEGN